MNISVPEEIIKSALKQGSFRGSLITCALLKGPSKQGSHFEAYRTEAVLVDVLRHKDLDCACLPRHSLGGGAVLQSLTFASLAVPRSVCFEADTPSSKCTV